jgi:hypothetical protein
MGGAGGAGVVTGILLLAGASGGAPGGPGPIVEPAVREQLAQGWARVLVELRVPGSPSAPTAAEIEAVRRAVLARLDGTGARLARSYASQPLVALEIGREALERLEAMGDLVARVRADVPVGFR